MKNLIILIFLCATFFSCQFSKNNTELEGKEEVIPESYIGPAWAKPSASSGSRSGRTAPIQIENKRFVDKVLQEIENEEYRSARKSPSAIRSVEEDIRTLKSSSAINRIDSDAGIIIDRAAIEYAKRVGITFGDTVSVHINN